MKSVRVLATQTLLDIAMQELGDYSRAMELAVLNGLKITDTLTAGTTLQVPEYDKVNRHLVNLFSDDSNKPGTGFTEIENAVLQGIGYWRIENNFRVS